MKFRTKAARDQFVALRDGAAESLTVRMKKLTDRAIADGFTEAEAVEQAVMAVTAIAIDELRLIFSLGDPGPHTNADIVAGFMKKAIDEFIEDAKATPMPIEGRLTPPQPAAQAQPWTPEEQVVITSERANLRPIKTMETTREIERGWGGVETLPVIDRKHGFTTAWMVPKKARNAFQRAGWVISVIVGTGPDGQTQMSIQIPKIEIINTQ